MSKEVITALIAFLGVAVSMFASLYMSSNQINNELHKFRLETQQIYSDKLLEKRLQIYPDMYFLLSDLAKRIDAGNFSQDYSQEDMARFFNKMNDWNSKNSLIFSGSTGFASYKFRQTIRQLLAMNKMEFVAHFKSPSAQADLKSKISEFELALKSDIGIYVDEFSEVSKRFKSYDFLDQEVTEFQQKQNKGQNTKP